MNEFEPTFEKIAETAVAPKQAEQEFADTDLRLVAIHPAQMEPCQKQLIAWADAKAAAENRNYNELSENIELAKKSGMRTEVIKRHALRASKRALFFSKVAAALRAGYYIIPNMPMDVFAIRRESRAPSKQASSTEWGHGSLSPLPPESLPAGEGEYRHPQLAERYRTASFKDDQGNDKKQYVTFSDGYRDEIDFPFALAKPQVLDATRQALALKIFDEVGVMPARQEKRSDPMVIGRIRNPSRPNDRDRDMSFLVAWFLDTNRL